MHPLAPCNANGPSRVSSSLQPFSTDRVRLVVGRRNKPLYVPSWAQRRAVETHARPVERRARRATQRGSACCSARCVSPTRTRYYVDSAGAVNESRRAQRAPQQARARRSRPAVRPRPPHAAQSSQVRSCSCASLCARITVRSHARPARGRAMSLGRAYSSMYMPTGSYTPVRRPRLRVDEAATTASDARGRGPSPDTRPVNARLQRRDRAGARPSPRHLSRAHRQLLDTSRPAWPRGSRPTTLAAPAVSRAPSTQARPGKRSLVRVALRSAHSLRSRRSAFRALESARTVSIPT